MDRKNLDHKNLDRRTFLKTVAGTGAIASMSGLSMPALAQGAAGAKTLRFVPQGNLANFDPIWGTQYVVRNAAMLVWDTLYGMTKEQGALFLASASNIFG